MIVLTSSSVAILFVTAGLVPWQYAVTFFSICFCGAYIGKTYIDAYVKKTGKASVLIFLLATIIALATIGCIVIVLTRLADAGWCFDGFQEFCSVHVFSVLSLMYSLQLYHQPFRHKMNIWNLVKLQFVSTSQCLGHTAKPHPQLPQNNHQRQGMCLPSAQLFHC